MLPSQRASPGRQKLRLRPSCDAKWRGIPAQSDGRVIAEEFALQLVQLEKASGAGVLGVPLVVTAPRGFFVYSGSLAVSPCRTGRDKTFIFKQQMCDLGRFVATKFRGRDIEPSAMMYLAVDAAGQQIERA